MTSWIVILLHDVCQVDALLSSPHQISTSKNVIQESFCKHTQRFPWASFKRMSTINGPDEDIDKISLSFSSKNKNVKLFDRRSFTLQTSFFALTSSILFCGNKANAAPPMAVIAEELGYFPVTNRNGDTIYVSARVKRHSTEQAVALAEHLKSVSTSCWMGVDTLYFEIYVYTCSQMPIFVFFRNRQELLCMEHSGVHIVKDKRKCLGVRLGI